MKLKYNLDKNYTRLLYALMTICFFTACSDDDIDNYKSRNKYNLEMTSSAEQITLKENAPNEEALSLEWTPAADWGSDFTITYLYEIDLLGNKEDNAVKEYEDGGVFKRSYTNKELQELMVDRWGQLTSTTGTLRFTITATYEGPRTIIPETSVVSVKVKTYGPKQFLANKLYMSGTAIGADDVEILPSKNDPKVFVYNGNLEAGTINFPIVYDDEVKENVISPVSAQQPITDDAMEATVKEKSAAGVWQISTADQYRVTVNLTAKTVTIIPAGDIIEVDKIYLAGTSVGDDIEVAQTLEDQDVFAFRGELKAGTLYLPILFNEEKVISIAPAAGGNQDIADGQTVAFAQVTTETADRTDYWNIPADGVYRIVVNIDSKTIAIYSAATDLQPKEVSWNNTVIGQNPFVSKVEALWMYGGFNSFAGDGNGFTGFHDQYMLQQSLANPYVFVYKGDNLPRATITDEYDKKNYTGVVRFCVSNIHNNVYAYGSTADAKRGSKNGYIAVASNAPQELKEGQGDNRYAYFLIPENTNYVMVNIETLTVVFDSK